MRALYTYKTIHGHKNTTYIARWLSVRSFIGKTLDKKFNVLNREHDELCFSIKIHYLLHVAIISSYINYYM